MAITARSLRLLQQLRKTVGGETDDAVRAMSNAWAASWRTLSDAWVTAVDQVLDALDTTGRWPTPYELARLDRLTEATGRTQAALTVLAASAGTRAAAGTAEIVAATAGAEPAIMAAQLPTRYAAAALAAYARKIVPSALEAITVRAQQQIHQQLWPLSARAVDAMRRRLITGIATGANPREAARQMVRDVEGDFNGGLGRAMNIARTEMVDAYRETSLHVHTANADVLSSWRWLASLGPRCCPGCWAMHGTEWPVDQPGPWDHHSGRCARMPVVKPWREIGINIGEPADDFFPDAKERFATLDRTDRLAVMGPRRLALLDSGLINLADLATLRTSTAWRASYAPMPVRDLERIAERRRRPA